MRAWVTQFVQLVLVLAFAPLLTGLTRRIRARLLRRQGPPLLQPYRDLARLMRKEAVVAHNASWLFRSAPYLIFAATWVAASLVPTFAGGLMFSAAAHACKTELDLYGTVIHHLTLVLLCFTNKKSHCS